MAGGGLRSTGDIIIQEKVLNSTERAVMGVEQVTTIIVWLLLNNESTTR